MSVATPSTVPITNYGDFWPHYLREHAKPETRALHYIGTLAGTAIWLLGLWTGNYQLIPAGIFVGTCAHSLFENLTTAATMGISLFWLITSFVKRRILRSMGWALLCRA